MKEPTDKDLQAAGALLRYSELSRADSLIDHVLLGRLASMAAVHGAEGARHFLDGMHYVKGVEMHETWRLATDLLDGRA